MTRLVRALLAAGSGLLLLLAHPALADTPKKETNCTDGIDNDGDSLIDCFDADCYGNPACKSSGGPENSDRLCSDGVDNDGDGAIDCEDLDCQRLGVTVCKGSWQGPLSGTGIKPRKTSKGPSTKLPTLGKGMSVEDLLGKGPDKDGERNDFVCSDGIDNDGDGMIDCEDYGCRFDPSVTVCQTHAAGIRFSVAAHVSHSVDFESESNNKMETRFSKLQLRAFGNIPGINNSFFLISIRAENTVRLTFATFEVPLYKNHRLNINSGSGGLSNGLVLGTQKRIMLDAPFYLYSAFESGNGASLEVNGPILQGTLDYRLFVSGGSGRFDGNVGGRFFKFDELNYAWAAGGQLAYFAVGRFDRWDTRFLYTEVPLALSFYLGGRFDTREAERFPAVNLSIMFRFWRFIAVAEGYFKYELNFKSTQISGNVTAGMLLIPKWLMLAADIGTFRAFNFDLPADITAVKKDELKRINDEFQWRVALHLFVYRNTGVFSLLYRDRFVEDYNLKIGNDLRQRELRVEAQYRF